MGSSGGSLAREIRRPPVQHSIALIEPSGPNGFVPRMQFTAADKGAFGYIEIYQVAKTAALTAPQVEVTLLPRVASPQ